MADFDFKAASESMMDFIKKVETEIGPRLPGSDEERAGAKLIKEEYEKNIGIKPVSEPFKVAPESGIGSIPYIGIGGLIALIAFFIYPIAGAVIAALCFIYFALMGGFYTQIFDFLWKKKDTEKLLYRAGAFVRQDRLYHRVVRALRQQLELESCKEKPQNVHSENRLRRRRAPFDSGVRIRVAVCRGRDVR